MKLLVQWATEHPRGWVELDSSEWAALAKKPVPVGGEEIDDAPGWLSNVCVQGMCSGSVDHVAVEHLDNGVRVTLWKDDPEDYEPSEFFARVLTFHPLKPDSRLGGAINTDIESVMYAGADRLKELEAVDFADTEVKPWSEFVPPPEAITRHGIWLTDELAAAHRPLAVPPSWREWGEDGTVPPQRALGRYAKAKGTITYYWRGQDNGGSGDDAYSDLKPAIGQNFKLTLNSTTLNEVTRDLLPGTEEEISFAFSTAKDDPGEADWPLGDYRAQIDINGLESGDVHCRTRILQVSDLGVIRDTLGTSSLYTTTGTKLFTISGYNPAIGAEGDRYQIRVLGWNEHDHQFRMMTLGVRTTDSFADGPWTAAVVHEGAATVTGSGSVSATAGVERPGAATVSGVGAASGAGALTLPGEATASGAGFASGTATVSADVEGAAIVTGVGSATGIAALTLPGEAVATGVGSASATGAVTADVLAAATATGVGTTAADATMTVVGAATVKGVGSTTAAAEVVRSGAGTATGVGTASGTATVTADVLGAATATGIGDVSATAGLTLPGAATAVGAGIAVAAAVLILVGVTTATGVAFASGTATVTTEVLGAATATGVGTVLATGTVQSNIAHWGEPCEIYTGGPQRGAH
jgi:hypothetical protein